MYFPDLSPYSYFLDKEIENILNVGWLETDKEFQQGEVAEQYIEKLEYILLKGLDVCKTRGGHLCPFCGDKVRLHLGEKSRNLGSSEIWIPTNSSIIYAAPNMIYHYVKVHGYEPPQEFLDALEDVIFPQDWGEDWVIKELTKRMQQ